MCAVCFNCPHTLTPTHTPQALAIEPVFRDAGVPVFSNAAAFRMAPDVPLVVPQVNGDHLEMVRAQPSFAKNGGFIVTNANCEGTRARGRCGRRGDRAHVQHPCTPSQVPRRVS
jgi:hypothetical protein